MNDLDVVIFCIGYKIGFKFIDYFIFFVSDNKVELYKYLFFFNFVKLIFVVLGCI